MSKFRQCSYSPYSDIMVIFTRFILFTIAQYYLRFRMYYTIFLSAVM